MLPLLLLKRIGWKRVGLVAGVAAFLGLVAAMIVGFFELQKLRLAYKNPRVVHVTRTVVVRGPVQIKERIIREPGGREEITREEVRGAVVESSEGAHVSEPVFPPAARPPRWIASASLLNFEPANRTGWTAWGGTSIGGRLDVQLGLGGDFRSKHLMVSWRW